MTTPIKTQHYNRTDFPSPPRLFLSTIASGQYQPSNPNLTLGYTINIIRIGAIDYDYTVTGYGVVTMLLRYNYLAVLPSETWFYGEIC